ncbi:MAG: transglutaminase, partial [Paenibacillus sp.]|nr:transglutaminase [Paenibacillus sp.]
MASLNNRDRREEARPASRPFVREAFATVMLFVLLMEWLLPLAAMSEYTDLHMLRPFVIAFGFFMLIDYSRIPLLPGWLLKLAACLCLIGLLFYRNEWMGFSWLEAYFMESLQDIGALLSFSLDEISPHNRTLMFLLGWALLITVMYATVVERQQAMWLIAITIVYLIGLQLWADVDTSWGILRTSAAGMLLMAINQLSWVEGQFRPQQRFGAWSTGRWSMAAAAIMAVAIGAGLWLSRDEARLVKPLAWNPMSTAWTKLFSEAHSSDTAAELLPSAGLAAWTGYSSNDSRLGGPIKPDDGIAFTARTEQATYWRGESRSTYTGRGWISGLEADAFAAGAADHAAVSRVTEWMAVTAVEAQAAEPAAEATATISPFAAPSAAVAGLPGEPSLTRTEGEGPRHITIQQEVLLENESLSSYIFAGGRIASVDALVTRKGKQLDTGLIAIDPATGRTGVSTSDPIGYYRLQVQIPADGQLRLAQAAISQPLSEAERANLAADLQLPASLPERVRELTKSVAARADNDYSRALAIQAFLRSQYTYSMEKPAFPSENQDFVDHFLFDQQVGYCDHFSTSMVVMLRTLGIPARWVKGFAPGHLSTDDPSPTDTLIAYTILNRDAHSWVEAYFPDLGWVSFEPTPGFTDSSGLGQDSVANPIDKEAISVLAQPNLSSLEGNVAKTSASWYG